MTNAVLGIVDDNTHVRAALKGVATNLSTEENSNSIKVPTTFNDTENMFLFNNLDGVLIDVNLFFWEKELPKRVIKHVKGVGPIHDGIDIANLAYRLFKKAKDAIYIYSSEVDLREPRWVQKLASLPFDPTTVVFSKLERYQDVMQRFLKPWVDKAHKVRTANPLFQLPNFFKTSPSQRIHAFKSVYFSSANWANCHFDVVGDHAFLVLCGHKVETDYYGSLLGEKRRSKFGIKPLGKYLDLRALKTLAKRRNHFPFPFWNVRKLEFIQQQFEEAGPRLSNIPDIWRSAFGVTMARPCVKAYVDHRERRLLKLCQELDEPGQIEVTKIAYKNFLGRTSGMSEFKRDAKQFELPQIMDILEGRVEEINKKESKAVVLLRSLNGGLPFTEVFDLKMLKAANVEFIAQRFDYTVYQKAFGPISAHVEPVYDEGRDL